jgi:ABC-type Fe3+/spermidine/putrescine transport system ATPase subunit
MSTQALRIANLTKRFGKFSAVDTIDLELHPGELLALLGPSGCGKTTTLRMVAGLERPTDGEISFGDKIFVSIPRAVELPPEKRQIGMVFQSYALWPHMTVFENIAYPLQLRSLSKDEIRRRVRDVLDLVNLSHLEARQIPQLSGGQQQRIALARALVYEPALMLFDEPFSNLDTQLRGQMRLELKSLRRKVAMTGLFVTHDQVEALSMADRIAIMRSGRIEQIGTPSEVYRQPKSRFVRDFLGRVVNLRGVAEGGRYLVGDNADAILVDGPIAPDVTRGSQIELSIRPEFVEVVGADSGSNRENSIDAVIDELLFTGDRFEANMRIGQDRVLFDLPSSRSWRIGDHVRLRLPPDALSVWRAEKSEW